MSRNTDKQLKFLMQVEDKNIRSFARLARRVLISCNPSVDIPAFVEKSKMKTSKKKSIKKPDKRGT